jgi:hypothetical protein
MNGDKDGEWNGIKREQTKIITPSSKGHDLNPILTEKEKASFPSCF